MKSTIEMVKEFQDAFGQKTPEQSNIPPCAYYEKRNSTTPIFQVGIDLSRISGHLLDISAEFKTVPELRLHLLTEELAELTEAFYTGDIVAALDALTDLQYVLDGTYLALGFTREVKEAAFKEVHSSNMSKLNENGQPILNEAGRVMKGPNYFKPNLEQFIVGKE